MVGRFCALLVFGVLVATQLDAKEPPVKYDFTIEMSDFVPTIVTGAVDEVYGWRKGQV
jgi:hypothetical protein